MTASAKWAWLSALEIILVVTPLLFPQGIPPTVAVACYVLALLLAAYAGMQWLRIRRLEAVCWRGFAAHFILRLHEGQAHKRRYLFDQRKDDGASASLFLSASDVFTLCVTDVRGEQYPLETPLGRVGMPIAQWVYVAVEVALMKKTTKLSLAINGGRVTERILGFCIDLGTNEWGKHGTIGADREGQNNAKFDLGEFILRERTLSAHEKKQLLNYFENKWHIMDH